MKQGLRTGDFQGPGDGQGWPRVLLYQLRCYYIVMRRPKISTTLYLEAEQLEELRAQSSRTQVPVAVTIRRAIERELARTRAARLIDSLSVVERAVLARMVGVLP